MEYKQRRLWFLLAKASEDVAESKTANEENSNRELVLEVINELALKDELFATQMRSRYGVT